MGYYNITPEQATAEEKERELDQMLERVLTSEAAVKINEGNNGIILELDTTNLPEEVRDYFSENSEDDSEEDEKVALKLLKIYTGTEGRHEYDLQKKARRVLKEEKIEGVKVPKPRNFRELVITSDDIAKHLKSLGIKIGPERIVEIISMDLVPGQDLARLMYQAYVREHESEFNEAYPDLDLESHLQRIDVNSLINLVHHLAGIKNKYSNFDDSPQASQERAQIARTINQDIAYKGILDRKHADNLSKAISALHKHGIYHRDLHPRNIMIDEDGNLEIIDFGSAKEINPEKDSDVKSVYQSGPEHTRPSDRGIISIVKQLSKTEADREQETRISRLGDPETLLAKLSAKKPKIWTDFIAEVKQKQETEDFTSEDVDKIISLYENLFGRGSDHKIRIALLLEMSKLGRKEEVINYLKAKIETENSRNKQYRSDFLINQYQSLLDFLS